MTRIAFFGTDSFSIGVLNAMEAAGVEVELIVAPADRPAGRKLAMTAPPIAEWARERDIDLFQPEKLDAEAIEALRDCGEFDAFVVASYGKIIPQAVLDLPKAGCLNVHPSPLPKHRGASPLEFTILADERTTGVTIIEMDAKMDHGPIAAFREVVMPEWPARPVFEAQCAQIGGELIAEVLPAYGAGTLEMREQNHDDATFTKKVSKADAQITLEQIQSGDRAAFLKIQAYASWPNAWFTIPSPSAQEITMRVVVKAAHFEGSPENGKLVVDRVVPEGSREMDWDAFVLGYLK
jgi:methionyl-tRNA formyltransferase